jgi:hypothetical protein
MLTSCSGYWNTALSTTPGQVVNYRVRYSMLYKIALKLFLGFGTRTRTYVLQKSSVGRLQGYFEALPSTQIDLP